MKHKTHPKSMNVRLLTMLLACALVIAGMPSAVFADTFPKEVFKVDFSTEEGFELNENSQASVVDGALKLSAVGDSVSLKPSLKVNTNYTFSFKMKNTVKDALSMRKEDNFFYFRDDNKGSMEDNAAKAYNFFIAGGSFSYVVHKDLSFGTEQGGKEWKNISINFTTPWQSIGVEEAKVNLSLSCIAEDSGLYVDDLCVVETGNAPNRVFNGDLEAFDATGDTIIPTGFDPAYDKLDNKEIYEYVYDEETDNHYLKVTAPSGKYPGLVSAKAFLAKLDPTNTGGKVDYHFSVRYKQSEIRKNSNAPRFRFYGTSNAGLDYISHGKLPELDESLKDTWVTYNVYLNGDGWIFSNLAGSKSADVWFGHQQQDYCMDDLYIGFDETKIDFHERLDFFYEDGDVQTDRYFNSVEGATPADMLMSERSIPASSLVKLEDADKDGFINVTPRLHYVPTKNADETYDVQDISFIAAVYKKVGDKKVLYSMDVATGKTTADGKTIDIKIDDVEVPAEDGYYIEAMAWDGTNTMKPVKGVDKTVFN